MKNRASWFFSPSHSTKPGGRTRGRTPGRVIPVHVLARPGRHPRARTVRQGIGPYSDYLSRKVKAMVIRCRASKRGRHPLYSLMHAASWGCRSVDVSSLTLEHLNAKRAIQTPPAIYVNSLKTKTSRPGRRESVGAICRHILRQSTGKRKGDPHREMSDCRISGDAGHGTGASGKHAWNTCAELSPAARQFRGTMPCQFAPVRSALRRLNLFKLRVAGSSPAWLTKSSPIVSI